jgi:hypothetical protein
MPEVCQKFLDTYEQLKLNREDINHLTGPITSNGNEAAIVSQKRKVKKRKKE